MHSESIINNGILLRLVAFLIEHLNQSTMESKTIMTLRQCLGCRSKIISLVIENNSALYTHLITRPTLHKVVCFFPQISKQANVQIYRVCLIKSFKVKSNTIDADIIGIFGTVEKNICFIYDVVLLVQD